ncbi:MAG: hypothetical protein H8E85_05240 [Candidatus Marinimicrobia bacterium]|nr:hypothetical protein [Candidatus Neomarinimicrobiota bacterium]
MKKMMSFAIITGLFILGIWFSETKPRIMGRQPVPTEFNENKSKRKDFKNQRKEYIKNMHRAHPDVDWVKMDAESRKIRTDKVRKLREELSLSRDDGLLNNQFEQISRDLSGVWNERGSNNLSGRIRTSEIDWENELIYCASSGGNIWRGSLEGENWTSLNDYMQITGITMLRVVYFENTRRLLIGSGEHFYYTDDDGVTLEESTGLEFLSGYGSLKRSVVRENDNEIFLLVNEGSGSWNEVAAIYQSIDFGQSFTKILTLDYSAGLSSSQGSGHFDIWTPRYFDGDVYLLNDNDFYRVTENDGLEFVGVIPASDIGDNLLTGGMGTNYPFFYAHVNGRIYHSQNGGSTWIDKGNSPQWYFSINSFNSSNINRENIYWGGMESFRSTNSGSNWTLVNNWWDYYGSEETKLHADIPEIRFFLDSEYNEVALIGTDGGLYFSDDGLQTVQNLSMSGLGVSQYYSTYTKKTEPFHLYAGAQDQGFQRSLYPEDEVLNFEQSISGDYGHLVSGDGGETIWCNYPGFTMYYPNPLTNTGGETIDFPGSGHLWLAPLMADPYDGTKAYLGGGGLSGGNHLFHLSMGGWSLSYEEESYSFNGTVSAMAFSPLEPEHRYVLTSGGSFYHSSDDGINWQKTIGFNGPSSHYFYGSTIWASENTPEKLIIGGSGYSNSPVYISYNHGASFEPLNDGLPNTLVYKLTGTPNDQYFFAATEVGPYVYISDDDNWSDLSGISAPDQTYWTVEYIPELNTARFATYGRGIWDFVLELNSEISGDVNFDEMVNIQDIILLVNFVLGIEEPTSPQLSAGDINGDDFLNIQDIIATINIILYR